MKKYNNIIEKDIIRHLQGVPGKENPIPTRADPDTEPSQPTPSRLPKRKKNGEYEIVMN